jgi:hypothetical protein
MVDGTAIEVDISIGERDFQIKQSPGILQSKREGGTTGAVVWECSVRFADWLSYDTNGMFAQGVLGSGSSVLELGSGISGLVPLVLAPRVGKVVATDQAYALPLLRANVDANSAPPIRSKARKGARQGGTIEVLALDWETDDLASTFRSHDLDAPFDAVVACDCVFNYALIEPFVQTCVESCKYSRDGDEGMGEMPKPAICVVAQQLRQPDVFQQWLEAFSKGFRVWRVPGEMLTEGLREGRGFVVHAGVLK